MLPGGAGASTIALQGYGDSSVGVLAIFDFSGDFMKGSQPEHPSTVAARRTVSRLLASSACSAAELRSGLRCAAFSGDLGGLLEDLGAALDPDRLTSEDEADAQLPAASALRCLGAAPALLVLSCMRAAARHIQCL